MKTILKDLKKIKYHNLSTYSVLFDGESSVLYICVEIVCDVCGYYCRAKM